MKKLLGLLSIGIIGLSCLQLATVEAAKRSRRNNNNMQTIATTDAEDEDQSTSAAPMKKKKKKKKKKAQRADEANMMAQASGSPDQIDDYSNKKKKSLKQKKKKMKKNKQQQNYMNGGNPYIGGSGCGQGCYSLSDIKRALRQIDSWKNEVPGNMMQNQNNGWNTNQFQMNQQMQQGRNQRRNRGNYRSDNANNSVSAKIRPVWTASITTSNGMSQSSYRLDSKNRRELRKDLEKYRKLFSHTA